MPYAEGRLFYDADSHIMELPGWLTPYADPNLRDRIPPFSLAASGRRAQVDEMIRRGQRRAANLDERAGHEAELMTRKSWDAHGAFESSDRASPLDLRSEERRVGKERSSRWSPL